MPIRILVIDDEIDLCIILQTNLKKEGYQVDYVTSAVEALTLDLTSYQLLIVDIRMERMNGYEFVERVRNSFPTQLIPIIFCSANDKEEDKLTGFDVGADDYITKPFDLRTVSRRVKTVLKRCYPELND